MNLGRTSLLAVAALALAVAARTAPPEDPIVELPPFIVNEAPRPWRYVATDGLEVLSRCADAPTIAMVRRLQRLDELVRLVLPDELRFRTAAPHAVVLVEAVAAPAASRRLIERYVAEVPRGEFRMLPNLGFSDVDALATFAIVDPRTLKSGDVTLAIDHLRMLLERRVPRLPAWYVEGCFRVLSHADFADRELVIARLNWTTDALQLVRDPDTARELLPAPEFFARARRLREPGSDAEREEDRYLLNLARLRGVEPKDDERWKIQAELFVRWCLAAPARRQALARFVAESVGPESEAVFRSCFGFGYADWRDRLSDYLPDATARRLILPLATTSRLALKPRDATPAEIGRLKLEWERLAWLHVRSHQPQFAPAYLAVARQTAATVHRDAPADPGVCGAEGLLEVDAGEPAPARALLELAVQSRSVRPRIYAELARLQLADAVTVSRAIGRIPATEAEAVLGWLRRAAAQRPPLALTDALVAEVWARADLPLEDARRAALEAALSRFPEYPQLLYYSAVLFARTEAKDRARQLIARGRAAGSDPAFDARFDRLERALQAGQPPTVGP